MKRAFGAFPLTFGIIATAIVVTMLYAGFEHIVNHAIPLIWESVYDYAPGSGWAAVLLLSVCFGLIYFAAQHFLDRKAESHESHALGDIPPSSIRNITKVLLLGFLSLLAGATLGVESILVPASIMAGAYVSAKLYAGSTAHAQALAAAAFISLFTAFFHSFVFGILALYLLSKSQGIKLTVRQFVIAILAALTTLLTLYFLPGESIYLALPQRALELNLITVMTGILLVASGFVSTYVIHYAHDAATKLTSRLGKSPWWHHALLASSGIGLFYIAAGQLVWFTGNLSIVPMLKEAEELGFWGLLWLAFVKLIAIGWSKAWLYRGGLIFPLVFVASVFVAMAMLVGSSINFPVALIAVMIGAFIANNKLRILF